MGTRPSIAFGTMGYEPFCLFFCEGQQDPISAGKIGDQPLGLIGPHQKISSCHWVKALDHRLRCPSVSEFASGQRQALVAQKFSAGCAFLVRFLHT
jgi:hypothetical protein